MHGPVKDLMARRSAALSPMQGYVSVAQYVLWLVIARFTQDNAHACAHAYLLPIQIDRHGECLFYSLRNTNRVRDVFDVLEEDHKLVAPNASHRVATAQAPFEPSGHLDNQSISGFVPEAYVDSPEAIQVQKGHGKQSVLSPSRMSNRLFHAIHEKGPIRQTCQLVMTGLID